MVLDQHSSVSSRTLEAAELRSRNTLGVGASDGASFMHEPKFLDTVDLLGHVIQTALFLSLTSHRDV